MKEEKVVKVQQIPSKKREKADGNRELFATVAYHYPQYTLEDISKLPYRDVALLMRVAERIKAEEYFTITQVVASQHTEKLKGIKQLLEHFKEIMEK